ncbi:MAG: helix-turn-helix transcriptional regulator [Bacteroidota bacterium]
MQTIGKNIEAKLRERGISVTEFARRINTNRNNAYDIFHRESIDTQLLQKISSVLEYDFFQLFNANASTVSEPITSYQNDNSVLQQKILDLEKENSFLKEFINDKNRIISLLEQRVTELQG